MWFIIVLAVTCLWAVLRKHSGWYPDKVTRLYAREQYQYNDNLSHESLETQGATIKTFTRDLLHLTCRDLIEFQQKTAKIR